MKLRKYKDGDEVRVDAAYDHLRKALRLLRRAGADKAAERVRSALRSAQGAQRHAHRIAERNHIPPPTDGAIAILLHCPACGEAPKGTLETIPHCIAQIDIDPDGTAQYSGYTEVNWDQQHTEMDEETGRPLLACSNCYRIYVAPRGFKL